MKQKTYFQRFLDLVEKSGDKLPDPFFLFLGLALVVLLLSFIGSAFDITAVHPGSGESVPVENLLTKEGIRRILTEAINNFIGFPPLGLVLVTLIGIAVADKSGLFNAILRSFIQFVPKWALSSALVFAGVLSNIIADSGIVVLPPLGAMMFLAAGRHPIAGLTAAFAGILGGFSANIFITSLDPLLSGFTHSAAQMLDSNYNVYPTANYYYMIASTGLVTIVCTFVTNYFVEPRLGKWQNENNDVKGTLLGKPNNIEKKALWFSALAFVLYALLIVLITVPNEAILRDDDGTIKPFFKSIVVIIMLVFLICGLVYGYISGSIKSNKDTAKMIGDVLNTMGAYILLAFAAGQFIAYFGWSNLGIITAVKGAEFLKSVGFEGLPLLMFFFIFSSFLNIFIYSASAKWAVFAPIFVPMFMLMGFSPETTQAVYRTGDSITNIITPLLPYFPIMLVFAKNFDKSITLGKLLSSLMPYSIFLFFAWGIFLILWIIFGIPFGPGSEINYIFGN